MLMPLEKMIEEIAASALHLRECASTRANGMAKVGSRAADSVP
jgi:hypothetical protein